MSDCLSASPGSTSLLTSLQQFVTAWVLVHACCPQGAPRASATPHSLSTHTGISVQAAPCVQGHPHNHVSLDEGPAPPGQHHTSDSAQSYDLQPMEVQTWIITEYCDQGALQVRQGVPSGAGCRTVLGHRPAGGDAGRQRVCRRVGALTPERSV